MSKESISTMVGATNSVILKELIKEKDSKLKSLQSKVERLRDFALALIDEAYCPGDEGDIAYRKDLAKILEQR